MAKKQVKSKLPKIHGHHEGTKDHMNAYMNLKRQYKYMCQDAKECGEDDKIPSFEEYVEMHNKGEKIRQAHYNGETEIAVAKAVRENIEESSDTLAKAIKKMTAKKKSEPFPEDYYKTKEERLAWIKSAKPYKPSKPAAKKTSIVSKPKKVSRKGF